MSEHAHLLPRYLHLRPALRKVNEALTKALAPGVIPEGGEALGLRKRGVLVFDNEMEMTVLMDYCIHDVRREGRNAVDRALEERPFPEGSEEQEVLLAMKGATLSVFLVERLEPGVGFWAQDLLREGERFIFDVGISNSAKPGMVFSGRILTVGEVSTTTGASLCLGMSGAPNRAEMGRALGETLRELSQKLSQSPTRDSLNTAIVSFGLQSGASQHSVTAEPGESVEELRRAHRSASPRPRLGPSPSAPAPRVGHVGRNEYCPCGSGKKFKNCCLRRR